jgi:hypothetical protein
MRTAILLFSVLLVACGSKDSITLGANVQNVQVTVEDETLGTQLSGGFELRLELGSEATESTTVSLETFALVRDGQTLVAPLQATPVNATFPVTLGKGDSRTIGFAIDSSTLLDASDKDAICAGPVSVSGAVTDTLSGNHGLTSQKVEPQGC